jgi:hypothetical protein
MKGSKYAVNGMYDETKATLKGEGDDKNSSFIMTVEMKD